MGRLAIGTIEGLGKVYFRQVEFSLLKAGKTSVIVGLGIMRLDQHRFLDILQRLVHFSLFVKSYGFFQ